MVSSRLRFRKTLGQLMQCEAGQSLILAMIVVIIAQVSTNIHDPGAVPLAAVLEAVRELAAERGARPVAGEVVGLVPEAALRDLPGDVPLTGFDPELHVLERRLAQGPT